VRSIKVTPVSSNFLLKELDLSPRRKAAGFFFCPATTGAGSPSPCHTCLGFSSLSSDIQISRPLFVFKLFHHSYQNNMLHRRMTIVHKGNTIA
jgi:hypothetical protein